MSLETKFEALELQLTTQQIEVINALDTIISALGGAPPTLTTTLDDVVSAINSSATARAAEHTELMSALGLLNAATDIIINNNSLNAQKMIAAILSTACPCTTTAPLLAPPIDVTPTSLADEAKCRRIQFYLSVFASWLNKIANYGGAGAFVTGDVIGTLLGLAATEAGIVATGAEVGTVLGPPGVVIGAIVGLIVGAVGIFGASVLTDYATQYNAAPVQSALLAALFAATTADEGQTAFQSVIGANFSAIPAGIINALWWSAWSNDLYSGTPTVDDSGFDGTICAPPVEGTCTEYPFTMRGDAYGIVIFGTKEVPGDANDPWVLGDFNGWRVTYVTSDYVAEIVVSCGLPAGGVEQITIFNNHPQSFVVDRATTKLAVTTRYANTITSGTIEMCPPGTF